MLNTRNIWLTIVVTMCTLTLMVSCEKPQPSKYDNIDKILKAGMNENEVIDVLGKPDYILTKPANIKTYMYHDEETNRKRRLSKMKHGDRQTIGCTVFFNDNGELIDFGKTETYCP